MKKFLVIFVLFVLVVTGVFFYFKEEILMSFMKNLIVSGSLEKSDLIVALGGENIRKSEAVKLFRKGYAKKILFTGFDIEKADYERYGLKEKEYVYPVKFVVNTYEEALFSLETAKKNRFKSVIVVTSFYHTKRTNYIFKKLLEKEGIKVSVIPAFHKNFSLNEWWKNPYLRKVVAIEWLGYYYYKYEY